MSATRLKNAYLEWRRLAEAEGEAIRSSDWPRVEQCQSALRQLQPQIDEWTQGARAEWANLGLDVALQEKDFRSLISELIAIERQNSRCLEEVRATMQAQASDLESCGHTLRQVQRSYAPSRASAWTSFS